MSPAFTQANTSYEAVCVQCGSNDVKTLRRDPVDPRLQCNTCRFSFSASDSRAALEAGVIKPSSPESLASAIEPTVALLPESRNESTQSSSRFKTGQAYAPSKPAYVFLSRPRGTVEFCTKRDFKRTAVKWHDQPFDVFELKPVKLSVNVNIS